MGSSIPPASWIWIAAKGEHTLQVLEALSNFPPSYFLADWIIYHAFENYPGLRWIFGSYDLWCIWIKNFHHRLEKNSDFFDDPKLLELLESAVGAIPQVHIDGHGDDCKKKYHYAYTRFVAMTIGELVETPWAVEKLTGGSTRQMNDGHRSDTLDDFHGFWNWLKLQRFGASNSSRSLVHWVSNVHALGDSLKLKYMKAVLMLKKLQGPHDEFSSSFDDEIVTEWRLLYDKPLPGPRDDAAEDLFVSRVAQSQSAVLPELTHN